MGKPSFTATGYLVVRYAPVFEYMFIFSRGKPKSFNPIKDKINKQGGKKYHGTVRQADGTTKPVSGIGKKVSLYGQRHNIWKIAPCMSQNERLHPAQFPEQLANDHIVSWSNENDVVLDPFMGSGTTAMACIKTNRHYIGFELDPHYCDVACKRISKIKESDNK